MHHSEWIDQAKAVPVGQKRRVVHGAEATAAMDVYNSEAYWSAYCHRCQKGGKVYKEIAAKPHAAPIIHRKYLSKGDCIPIDKVDKEVLRTIVTLLHSKGMSLYLVMPFKPMYNKVDKRLVFSFDGVDLGRDTTGYNGAKWLVYYRDSQKGYVYLQPKSDVNDKDLVLTEDLFSAIKVNHYTGKACMCLLGTNFTDDKLNFIIDNKSIPVLALDGDEAGHNGEFKIKRRLDLFGIPYKCANIPDGFDPKDLNPKQLEDLFNA